MVLFVGEGASDEAVVPVLVDGILPGFRFGPDQERWARLHVGRGGMAGKVKYAVRQAMARGACALVATVDSDNERGKQRLKEMRHGRTQDRNQGIHFPTALGCAIPEIEAWLLDDSVATRRGLRLSPD